MISKGIRLKPFFTYYGGKHRAAPRYPAPDFGAIVEPFAGSAGYATLYPDRNVTLIDKNPIISNLWKYLISVSESEIMNLPVHFDNVDELSGIPLEAKHLIGFWLNKGSASPCKMPSAWMRSGKSKAWWGNDIKERIASQLRHIRHWKSIECDWTMCIQSESTWFVDPPYQKEGGKYKFHAIDYAKLGEWCKILPGQVIVCEAEGANWLDFRSIGSVKSNPSSLGKSFSPEMVWINNVTGMDKR